MADPKESLHVLIACGGTGGHLFPGIAVGEALKAHGHDVTLLISEKKVDGLAASGHENLRFEKMAFIAMPKLLSLQVFPFTKAFFLGLRDCKRLIKRHNINVVLGMGGFTSMAPVMAGRWSKCRTLIHDSNALPGKANRMTARFCDLILLGFEAAKDFFPKKEVRIVGTPVRANLRAAAVNSKEDPYQFFHLEKGRKTLLVVGGSQGARGVNEAVIRGLDMLDAQGWQILHIAGTSEYQPTRDAYQRKSISARSHVAAFCQRMELAYQVADVAIARSGASTLAELAYFGVPSVLVPFPFAADDHQTKNAEIFDKAGAGLLVPQKELTTERLASTLASIMKSNGKHDSMAAAARKLSVDDAAEKIATAVMEPPKVAPAKKA